ncbi:MAG: DUF1667 domain-containing protein [Sphaerochaetaceae bacterium]|mgnify:CR=1 FL=1|jgi:CxxC motif-containing protein|nr:DUF1667 domain-containing protein [Sphaerochaetaceae bacterium]NLO59972.1 DUF1667 domain-containing protein [Spirochaetales bacterium]MDD2405098.1 DUF1667 domain-containing protein [Sphaerochaetaceae bacterium]MDD4258981.1 DUF1667 domain-containing protein [Sphaerochaetaceae bacterium]MDD4762941.1 DUF1667 domain-containing protein [Sphaerochaetaceae bacterium]
MIKERCITCIICPKGCRISISQIDGELTIDGYQCSRGNDYARQVVEFPVQMLTTTVSASHDHHIRIPVKTTREIPVNTIKEAMRKIRAVRIALPVRIGEVIVENLLDLDVDVIATDSVTPHNWRNHES